VTGFNKSDLVLPPDAKDTFETAHYKMHPELYVTTIWGSCLATVQEDRDANGYVDSDVGPCCKVMVQENMMVWFGRKQLNRALCSVELRCPGRSQR